MQFDTIFKGVTAVFSAGEKKSDVCVKDGKIAALLEPGSDARATRVLDCDGLYLLPGLLDTHMHVRGPAFDYREDFTTGSAAAAAGGITTFLEMPVSRPPAYCVEVLRDRMADAQKKVLTNIAFYGAAGYDNLEHIVPMAKAGVIGYKTFSQRPVQGREKEFTGLCTPTSADLYQVCLEVAKTGLILAVHAEEDRLIDLFASHPEYGQSGPPEYNRPPIVELEATARALAIARETGARISMCHVSMPHGVEMIRAAKGIGQDVTIESCAHYLFCSHKQIEELGVYAKIKPPLRTEESRAKMWELFAQGQIDFLGSDHAPFSDEEKAAPSMPDGIAAVEVTLPMLLLGVAEGKFSLSHIAKICSENPARRFDLYPRKGGIGLGADADLVLVDLAQKGTIRLDALQTKSKSCVKLYEGRRTGGTVKMTMSGGVPVLVDGKVVAQPGSGSVVYPNGFQA